MSLSHSRPHIPQLHHLIEARGNSINGPAWVRRPPLGYHCGPKDGSFHCVTVKALVQKSGGVGGGGLTHKTVNVQFRLYVENTEGSKSPRQLVRE